MEFKILYSFDTDRYHGSWIFAQDDEVLDGWVELLKQAHKAVADMFLSDTPFVICPSDKEYKPHGIGQISRGVFIKPPDQIQFKTVPCILFNDTFWNVCLSGVSMADTLEKLNTAFHDDYEEGSIEVLSQWHTDHALQCFEVHKYKP